MVARTFDHEIAGRLRGRLDFRPDAAVAGRQGAVLEVRPVAADSGIEFFRPLRIDGVIDLVYPFHIGTEARLAGEVEGDVHTEAGRLGNRVNQPREGRASGE